MANSINYILPTNHLSPSGQKWFLWWFNQIQYQIRCYLSFPFGLNKNKWEVMNNSIVHIISQFQTTRLLKEIDNPKVITVHDLAYTDLEYLEFADKIICDSDSTYNEVIKSFPHIEKSKIHKVYLSVDLNEFKNLELPKFQSKTILAVGTDAERKNIKVIIKALKDLPDYQLIKIGGPTYKGTAVSTRRNELTSYAKSLNVENQITWVDNVTNYDLLYYYNRAHITILPSFLEGFGMSAVESMACGTPVIGSNLTSVPELLGKSGITFDPNNADQLVDKIKMFEDDEFYKKMKDYYSENVKTFSTHNTVSELISIYNELGLTSEYSIPELKSKIISTPESKLKYLRMAKRFF